MYVYRSLKAADWEKLRTLRLAMLEDSPQAYGVAGLDEIPYEDAHWQQFCWAAEAGSKKWFQVAESPEGELIGMLGAVEIAGSLMNHQVEIMQAYVFPGHRRRHVMEKLFFALKNALRKVPHLEQMIVWVTLHETQAGLDMFKKFGFTYAGKLNKTVKHQGRSYDCCWLEAPIASEIFP